MPDMWPLWTWGLRARRATALTLALLMATAVAASVAGPLLLRAVEQSALARAVADAGPVATSLTVSAQVRPDEAVKDDLAASQVAVTGASDDLFTAPVSSQESLSGIAWHVAGAPASPTAPVTKSRLVAAEACAGVRLVSGTCPTSATDVAVASVDAQRLAVALGATVDLTVSTLDATGTRTVPLKVTGTYDAAASPGLSLTLPGSPDATISGSNSIDLLVTGDQLAALKLTVVASTHRVLARPLTLADLPEVQRSIDLVRAGTLAQTGTYLFTSGLPQLLDDLTAENDAASTVVWVTQLQALALALGAIAVVLQRISRARAREWAVGRLRGVPRRTWLTAVYAEPVIALLVGAVVGVLAGVGAARLAADHALRPGTPLEPGRAPVVLTAVATLAGALVVLVAASIRSARADLAKLLGASTEERRTSRLAAVAQSVAVLLAAVTTWQLVSGSGLSGDRIGLLAPGLFALALAVLVMQAVTWRVRRAATSPARRLGTLVVGRQLGRTPSVLLRGVVIAIGVSLVVFVTQLTWASVHSQDRLASAETGAAQVWQVEVPAGTSLRQVVDTADPTGRVAMAVQERASSADGGAGRVVAVDTARLAAVAAWQSGWSGLSATELRARLRPVHTAPVMIRGTKITLGITSAMTAPGPLAQGISTPPRPIVQLTVEAAGRWSVVGFAPLADGSSTLTADLPCPSGCRLVSIGTAATTASPYQASYVVASLGTDFTPAEQYAALLRDTKAWQTKVGPVTDPARPWFATPKATADGLEITVNDDTGISVPAVEPTDLPDPLPAVVGPKTETAPFGGIAGAVPGVGLDGQAQLLRQVSRAEVLPRAMDDGVLVDLSAIEGLSDPAQSQATDEIWLAPGSHPAIERALRKDGVRVLSRERLADVAGGLKQQAPTRAAVAGLVLAGLAALLTLMALVAARVVDAPGRRRDWAALRAAGLRPARIRRLAVVEVALPAVLAAGLGAAAGVGAFALAVHRLPLRLAPIGPPLDAGPSWSTLGWVVLPVVALLLVIAAGLAVLESPRRVTQGPEGGGDRG